MSTWSRLLAIPRELLTGVTRPRVREVVDVDPDQPLRESSELPAAPITPDKTDEDP